MTGNEMDEAVQMVTQLLMAFPTGRSPGSSDLKILLPVYVEAIEDFEIGPVRDTIRALRLRNPRNPFPPTAQDVYERLKDATGLDPKKPPMTKGEWLRCQTAQTVGEKRALEYWDQRLSPEAKAREAAQKLTGGNSASNGCLAIPAPKRPS